MKLALFLLFCCIASLFGNEQLEDKIYLNESEIAIHDNQLFIIINNQWHPTQALFSDANGIYILKRKWYEPWDCGFCGATNPPHRITCWNCGR